MKIASLFSGIGGFEKGILQADPSTEIVFASEFDPDSKAKNINNQPARQIYKKNFGEYPHGDITKIKSTDVPDHDILVAGVPCQTWSIAGKRKGFEDVRGTMWYEVFRILKEKKPKMALLENVKGLLSHDKGNSFELICKELNRIGYLVRIETYNTKDFGLPQNRERVFLICTNIHEITNAGLNKKLTLSETMLQDYLFQILLNNLEEVSKLQEGKSKDLVLSYLLLKELIKNTGLNKKLTFSLKTKTYLSKNYQNFFLDENTLQYTINQDFSGLKEKLKKGITLIEMDEKSSTLNTELVWQNIDTLLKKNWEENYLGKNKYTISTAIKQITDWKTFTYSQTLLAIFTLIGHLRTSSNHLWNEILSNLIVVQEGTNYAKINNINEKKVISESGNYYDPELIRTARSEVFIIGHLGSGRTRKIFPIGNSPETILKSRNGNDISTGCISTRNQSGQAQWDGSTTLIARCLTGGGHSGGNHSDMTIIQVNNPVHSNNRIYNPDGISPAINCAEGGNRQPFILCDSGQGRKDQLRNKNIAPLRANTGAGHNNVVCHSTLPRGSSSGKGGTGHLQRDDGVSYCCDTKNNIAVESNQRIRRLMPIECEKLQGFPVRWTAEGINNDGDLVKIADTNRYKCLGNAVTVPVIEFIASHIFKMICDTS